MKLVLGDEGGPCHFLGGRRVNCGTQLKLFVGSTTGNPWRWVRYEANLSPGRVAFILHATFGIVIPTDATELRWPMENEQ